MDTQQLVEQARARFDHAAARRQLKEKYEARMVFAHANGMWRAGPELIILLDLYGDKEIVIQDLYANPVKINASVLLELAQARWQEQMNAWLVEFEQITQQR